MDSRWDWAAGPRSWSFNAVGFEIAMDAIHSHDYTDQHCAWIITAANSPETDSQANGNLIFKEDAMFSSSSTYLNEWIPNKNEIRMKCKNTTLISFIKLWDEAFFLDISRRRRV